MKNPTKSGLRQFSSSTKLHEKTVISSEIIPALLFSRIGNKTFLIFLVGTMLFLSSCDKEESTAPNTNDPEPTGNILVKISTLGADDDPDGYTLKVEGSAELNTDANGEYTIPNKRVGLYNVELTNISSHCTGNGNMLKEVTVAADGTTSVEFEVSCKAILRDRIVYSKGLDNFTEFKFHTSKLDGTNEKLLLDKVISFPNSIRISPDGTKLIFHDRIEENNSVQLFLMDANGDNLEMIPFEQNTNVGFMNQFNPVWHPDSKKITFRSGNKVVTYDLETAARVELELDNGESFSVNEILDNGNKFLGIYFINEVGEPAKRSIATMNSNGGDIKILKETTDYSFLAPRVVNGNTIVYMQRFNAPGFFLEPWMMNLDGTDDIQIKNKLGFSETDLPQSFTLSPDKTEMIFYIANGFNFYFGKTKINGNIQPINFENRALRIHPDWSAVTRK
ncbi:MAG: hypothetical protein EA341_05365 [Mongoliibacter sp.]|uniref:TolB family protein n=1 Tax=Mongoliibacter sp. TaxID=2022438 RepID=UPI0012F13CBB|nr:hypothetical protein [Mongoliibacter sp.]TVP51447.1 MAG: hypothetical protein EA341_05365 [Mongoliibacter sp.]